MVTIAVLAGVAAWAVALFGARWRFPALIERIYAAVTIYAGGIWLSAATAVGPSVPLMREALVIGAFILSVPWWAHRRRRAKVTLERKLQAWPDIAKAIGLAGLEVMSATVDVWGWRARFRLAHGQTIKDVVTKIPAIESGLGTFRGAVRVRAPAKSLIRLADRTADSCLRWSGWGAPAWCCGACRHELGGCRVQVTAGCPVGVSGVVRPRSWSGSR